MEHLFMRMWENLGQRIFGPMKFRLVPTSCTVSHVYVFNRGNVRAPVRQLRNGGETTPLLQADSFCRIVSAIRPINPYVRMFGCLSQWLTRETLWCCEGFDEANAP
jgi:hypothetical protein